jgi:ketosteroid isomerase-like protein
LCRGRLNWASGNSLSRSRHAHIGQPGILARFGETAHGAIHDLIEQDDKIVAIVTTAWRNKRTGKICEMPKADYWTFKNGKAVAIYEYYDTAKLIAAAS